MRGGLSYARIRKIELDPEKDLNSHVIMADLNNQVSIVAIQ